MPGRSVSRWGGFLDDVMGFDAPFFGFGEREAAAIDPQHRLLLETSWEAVEHAGLDPASLAGSLTGVFVGLSHDDYLVVTGDAGALADAYGFTGTPFSMASGRIAYRLGLHGPAMTVDTACSTGLLTVHLACRSLDQGESDLALAGGCMVMLAPSISSSASAQGMLSPTGTLPGVRRRARTGSCVPRVAPWCCSSGCPTRSGMVTGSWPWCAARPPTRMAAPRRSSHAVVGRAGRGVPGGVGGGGRGRRHSRHGGGARHRYAGR